MRISLSALVALFIFTSQVLASIPPLQATLKKQNRYLGAGSIVGGEAKSDLVLVDVRRQFEKKQGIERVVLELASAKTHITRVGYFNVGVDQRIRRVSIDLSGVAASQKPLEDVMKLLKKSPVISEAVLTMDPEDRSANLSLTINPGAGNFKVEAFELPATGKQKTGRLAIDIQINGA